MEIAKQLAGFSPAEADDLRKAIGKKIHSLMASLKDKFIAGCLANQVEPKVAEQLWKDMEQAQDYSFNKSHAACYALIAYRTAYLQGELPGRVHGRADLVGDEHEGQGAVLRRRVRGDGHRGAPARRQRLRRSTSLSWRARSASASNAVKNVGEIGRASDHRRRARTGGPFVSLWDFCERVDPQVVNKRALESLVKCGALDSTGASRKGMLGAARAGALVGRPPPRRSSRRAGVDLRPRWRRSSRERCDALITR